MADGGESPDVAVEGTVKGYQERRTPRPGHPHYMTKQMAQDPYKGCDKPKETPK